VKKMKKQWQTPELKVLDVSMTMARLTQGSALDKTYPQGTPPGQIWS
jgi:hypothetical protein